LALPVRGTSGRVLATVVVAQSTLAVDDLRREVLLGSVIISLLVLAAGAFAIHRAIGGALRPVADMTAAAGEWGAHDLERRFDLGPPRDELTGLAATLDALLGRIAASRRHEQRFASEVAHELRTPLSGMRGRAELALRPGSTGEEREAALRVVVEQAEHLAGTIDTLLVVARQELSETGGAVDVLTLVQGIEDVEIVAPASVPEAEGDTEVVRRALAPLVDNARRHARDQVRIEVSSDDGHVAVAVRDDGPGLAPELGERAFAPGVQGTGAQEGAGLGLPLARRLAQSCGGNVTAGEGPGGCFVLTLPRAPT
jgi:signal transduction histidine kinase